MTANHDLVNVADYSNWNLAIQKTRIFHVEEILFQGVMLFNEILPMKFRTPISESKFHSLAQKQIAGGPGAEERHWIFGNICKSTAFSSTSCCSAVSFLSLWRSLPCQCLGFTPKGTLWLVRRTVGVADMVQGWCWPVVVSHAAGSAFFLHWLNSFHGTFSLRIAPSASCPA